MKKTNIETIILIIAWIFAGFVGLYFWSNRGLLVGIIGTIISYFILRIIVDIIAKLIFHAEFLDGKDEEKNIEVLLIWKKLTGMQKWIISFILLLVLLDLISIILPNEAKFYIYNFLKNITSDFLTVEAIFIAITIIFFLKSLWCLSDYGILGNIEQLFSTIFVSVFMSAITTFILVMGYEYLVKIFELDKLTSLILAIISVALLGYIEVRMIFGPTGLPSIEEATGWRFLGAILGNFGIVVLINRLFSPLYFAPFPDLFAPIPEHGVLVFLAYVFLALTAGWAAVLSFYWEAWREEEARQTGVFVQPRAGFFMGVAVGLIGFYFMHEAAMVL